MGRETKSSNTHNQGGLDGDSVSKKSRKQARCFAALEKELFESFHTEGKLHNVPYRDSPTVRISSGGNKTNVRTDSAKLDPRHKSRIKSKQSQKTN